MVYTLTINRPVPQSAAFAYVQSEEFCVDNVTVLGPGSATLYDVGTVMGQRTANSTTVANAVAGGSNTGNGTVSASPSYLANVQNGTYTIEFVAATRYIVIDPVGNNLGVGFTGVAWAKQLGFTVTAGGTPFAAGDTFTMVATVAGTGEYAPVSASATDGTQTAAGIIYRAVTTPASGNLPFAPMVTRGAVKAISNYLLWPSGSTAGQQAAWLAQLAALPGGIVAAST